MSHHVSHVVHVMPAGSVHQAQRVTLSADHVIDLPAPDSLVILSVEGSQR